MISRNTALKFALRAHRRRCAKVAALLHESRTAGEETPLYKDATRPVEERVEDLLGRMSLEEKVAQMSMPETPSGVLKGGALLAQPVGTRTNARLGIPPLFTTGASRGATYFATAFPVAMARGASWDPDLEERVHGAIGTEAAAVGANVLLAPCINLVRHPGGGRSQETYGEDTFHLSRFAVAAVRGAQRHVIAQVKHYALNNIERDRFRINAKADERVLREVYLPHFCAAVVEGGAASVMSAYNKVNGRYCGEHRHLLREILKGEWGFDGFVMSDWILGTRSTVDAANNGLDMEMPAPRFYGKKLLKAVRTGDVPQAVVDDSVRRLLRKMFAFGLFEKAPSVDVSKVNTPEHRRLAREAAQKSMVLLKNERGCLPLETNPRLAVVGRFAAKARLGDLGSSAVSAWGAVSPYEGIREAAGAANVSLYTGRSPEKAARLAAGADAAVVVAALRPRDEGEWLDGRIPLGGDRERLSLSSRDIETIRAVARANPRTIVVIESGSAVTVEEWIDDVPAVLMAWYPGVEGGRALADLLFGKLSPSGKLPVSIPRSEEHLPPLGSQKPEQQYDLLHGYRHLQARGHAPRFAFGHGLSYTRFEFSDPALSAQRIAPDGELEASFDLTNVGNRPGAEVAQLYVSYPDSKVARPPQELKGFAKVELAPGERRRVTIPLKAASAAYWNAEANGWETERGRYEVRIGSSSQYLPLRMDFEIVG